MVPENFPTAPGTNPSHFVLVPVPVYIYVYPVYYPTQPPGFSPQHPMIEMTEQGCSMPSAQSPQYDEPVAEPGQTLIRILDPDEDDSETSVGEFLGETIPPHREAVSPLETLPAIESPAEPGSACPPEPLFPPEPLAKTEWTRIRIRDPNEGGREISIDELLGRGISSPPRPVSLSECLHTSVSLPDPESVFYPPTVSPLDPVFQHEPLITVQDPNKGGNEINEFLGRGVQTPTRPHQESLSESSPESLHETVCLHKETQSKPKRTLIRIRDPNEGGREISIEELLGERLKSPFEPVSLPESPCKPPPRPGSLLLPEPMSSPPEIESWPKTLSPLQTAPDSVCQPTLTRCTSPSNHVSLPESFPELVSPHEPGSPPKLVSSSKIMSPIDPDTVSPPKAVSPPKNMSLPEVVSSPKIVSPDNYLSVSLSETVSLPHSSSAKHVTPTGPVFPPESLTNTKQTLIKIRNPKKGGSEIKIDKILGRRDASPSGPASPRSTPMSLSETVFLPVPASTLESESPPEPMSPPGPVSPTDSASPLEPPANTKWTQERNQKSPVIRIWVSKDSNQKMSINRLLEKKATAPHEPVSSPKIVFPLNTVSLPNVPVSPLKHVIVPSSDTVVLSKTVSPPDSVSLPEALPGTLHPPKPVSSPETMVLLRTVPVRNTSLADHVVPSKPVSPPESLTKTEKTLVSSDGDQEIPDDLLEKRVTSPPKPKSLPKYLSLLKTLSPPTPVSWSNTVLASEPVFPTKSVPQTMSPPMSLSISETAFLPKTVSETMPPPKPLSLPTTVFHPPEPLSPPKSVSETVSPPRSMSPPMAVSRCRISTAVPLMWGDIMDALDAEQEEKTVRDQKKEAKCQEQREKVEKHQLSARSRNLPPQTPHSRNTKGVELFIRGLDFSIDRQRLYKEFRPFGDLISAKVIMKNGHSKGYGFVVYSTHMDAEAAIRDMNGKMLGEKPLFVALTPKMKSKR